MKLYFWIFFILGFFTQENVFWVLGLLYYSASGFCSGEEGGGRRGGGVEFGAFVVEEEVGEDGGEEGLMKLEEERDFFFYQLKKKEMDGKKRVKKLMLKWNKINNFFLIKMPSQPFPLSI